MALNPTAVALDGTIAPSSRGTNPTLGATSVARGSAGAADGVATAAIILATGSGATMRSERPKPLQVLCGRSMLSHVLHAVAGTGVSAVSIVTGPDGDRLQQRVLADSPTIPLVFSESTVGVGSAKAVLRGLERLDEQGVEDGDVLLVPADLPLLQSETLVRLLESHRLSGAACTVLGAAADLTAGTKQRELDGSRIHGRRSRSTTMRFVRNRHGQVERLMPDRLLYGRDLDGDEVGLGVYCVRRELLAAVLRRSRPDPNDGSYPLYGMVEVLADSGHRVEVELLVEETDDLKSIDSRRMLAEAEAEMRRRTNGGWMDRGVSMVDPERTYIDVTVRLGQDVTLFPGTMLQGTTVIGSGCEIGPDTRLDCCEVGQNSVIEKTMARLSTIGQGCRVGPFAVLEQGSRLGDGTRTGPFYAACAGEQS